MEEKFIERRTIYPMKNAKLSIFETNCVCRDILFNFEKHVLTLMLSGHKTIVTGDNKLEFFPGTVFIPENYMPHIVNIPNASLTNVTQCIVLEIAPDYLQEVYTELIHLEQGAYIPKLIDTELEKSRFLSNDKRLIEALIRLYEIQFNDKSTCKSLVEDLIIKEIIIRLSGTSAIHLFKKDFEGPILSHSIRNTIYYIKHNLNKKLTIDALVDVSGLGQTTLYKQFKESTGYSPIGYVLHERIEMSKILIRQRENTYKEIAFKCGFNSYEYFCSSFKKLTGKKPSEYLKMHQTY